MKKLSSICIATCLLLGCYPNDGKVWTSEVSSELSSEIEVSAYAYLLKHNGSYRVTIATDVFNSSDNPICLPSYYNYDDLQFVYTENVEGYSKRSGEINFFSSGPWDNYIVVPANSMRGFKHNPTISFKRKELPLNLNFDVVALRCQSVFEGSLPSFDDLVFLPADGNENTAVIERFEFRKVFLSTKKL